jgi:biopolymer transport protein ExbD
MSLKKTSRSQHSSLNELNITPLLDLVFVLLVIFIITTPQMMNNLEMNLPSQTAAAAKGQTQDQPHRRG